MKATPKNKVKAPRLLAVVQPRALHNERIGQRLGLGGADVADERGGRGAEQLPPTRAARRKAFASDPARRHSFDSSHPALASETGLSLNGPPGNDFSPKLTFLDQLLRNKYPKIFEFRQTKKNPLFYFEKKFTAQK